MFSKHLFCNLKVLSTQCLVIITCLVVLIGTTYTLVWKSQSFDIQCFVKLIRLLIIVMQI